MKKFVCFIYILFLPILSVCAEQKIYKVAITKNWKPYFFLDEKGIPSGYGVELFEKVARSIDLKYQFVIADDFKELMKLFKENKVDVIPNIGITSEREKLFLFTQSTDSFFVKIYKRKESKDIKILTDLKNKKVGVVKVNVCNSLINNEFVGKKIFYSNYDDMIVALKEKDIDAFCYPEVLINQKIDEAIIPLEKSLKEISRGFGVAKHEFNLLPHLNNAITDLKLNGEFEKIYNKWFEKKSYIQLTKSEVIFLVISFLGITFTSFVIMFYFLSKKKWLITKNMLINEVNKRTRILQIQNRRLKKIQNKLKEQTNKDALTKVYNRKFYNEKVIELISIYKRYKQPFSYMIFDIDDFKRINDRFGHDIGDRVLKELTKNIDKHIRENDYFFRVGGEEFVILFSSTTIEEVKAVANKIREEVISQIDFLKNFKVTISAGLTEIKKDDDEQTIYKRADILLYEAKKSGKNRVILGK